MFYWMFLFIAYIPFQVALNPGTVLGFLGLQNKFLKTIDLASLRIIIIFLFLFIFLKAVFKGSDYFKKWLFIFLKDWRSWMFFIFIIFCLISLLSAESVWWGLRKIIFFMSFFPLYFIIVNFKEKFDFYKIKKSLIILSISSGLAAVLGLFQFISPFIFGLGKVQDFWAVNIVNVFLGFNLGGLILNSPSWFVNVYGEDIMRAFGHFSDPHMFSFLLGLVLPLSVSCFYLFKNKAVKVNLILTSVIIYIAALLSFSRGSYLGLIASLSVFVFLIWQYFNFSFKKKILSFLVLSFALSLFIIPVTPIAGRFYSCFDLEEGSNQGRLQMWQQSAEQGLDHSFSGLGLGNYSLSVNSKTDYRNPITAHNLYLDLFSEVGVFGLLVWLAIIIGTFFELWKILKTNLSESQKIILVGLMSSLVYFSVHSFFETAIYNPVIISVILLILGLSSVIINNNANNINN